MKLTPKKDIVQQTTKLKSIWYNLCYVLLTMLFASPLLLLSATRLYFPI